MDGRECGDTPHAGGVRGCLQAQHLQRGLGGGRKRYHRQSVLRWCAISLLPPSSLGPPTRPPCALAVAATLSCCRGGCVWAWTTSLSFYHAVPVGGPTRSNPRTIQLLYSRALERVVICYRGWRAPRRGSYSRTSCSGLSYGTRPVRWHIRISRRIRCDRPVLAVPDPTSISLPQSGLWPGATAAAAILRSCDGRCSWSGNRHAGGSARFSASSS